MNRITITNGILGIIAVVFASLYFFKGCNKINFPNTDYTLSPLGLPVKYTPLCSDSVTKLRLATFDYDTSWVTFSSAELRAYMRKVDSVSLIWKSYNPVTGDSIKLNWQIGFFPRLRTRTDKKGKNYVDFYIAPTFKIDSAGIKTDLDVFGNSGDRLVDSARKLIYDFGDLHP